MQGKITLSLAISIDGYIADNNGGFDWIHGDGSDKLNTKNSYDFEKFVEGVDVILMGGDCFRQNMHEPFKHKDVYVATHDKESDRENLHFISGDIVSRIMELVKEGKHIFLFGGGKTIDPFIKRNVIDQYDIAIIPTILGSGRRLFLDDNPTIELSLEQYSVSDGTPILTYIKK